MVNAIHEGRESPVSKHKIRFPNASLRTGDALINRRHYAISPSKSQKSMLRFAQTSSYSLSWFPNSVWEPGEAIEMYFIKQFAQNAILRQNYTYYEESKHLSSNFYARF